MLKQVFILLLLFQISMATTAADDWGDDDWNNESESSWTFSGFSEIAYGQFLQNNIVASNASLSEFRVRLALDYSHDYFDITAKGNVLYDTVKSDNHQSATLWNTRELTLSASPFATTDIKIGRQVLTWGTGDYLFLNDLFPKNWQAFFSGREDEYLKSPSDSVRITNYWKAVTLDIAWTPEFTPDVYLTGERFSFYSQEAQRNIAPAGNFTPEHTTKSQVSARAAVNYHGVEVAFYGYKGFWPTPNGVNVEGAPYFPKLQSLGASLRIPLGKGLFNSELSFYDSLEDPQGTNPLLPNSQLRLLIGYEQEAAKNLTISAQYYVEKTPHYPAFTNTAMNSAELADKYRQLVTLRLRFNAMQQKLTFSLFGFYSPTDNDTHIRPSIHYRANDAWSYSAGGNLFSGKHEYSFFGQHEDNTNAWLRVRYQF